MGGLLSASLVAVIVGIVTTHWIELLSREGDPAEHLAGVFCTAGIVTAFLHGDAVLQHRNHQLGIPLQPDDGKLAQSNKEPSPVAGEHQLFVK